MFPGNINPVVWYKCADRSCDQLFDDQEKRQEHMKCHRDNVVSTRECPICGISHHGTQVAFKIHMKTHQYLGNIKFWCQFCHFGYETEEAKKEHEKLHEPHLKEYPFRCVFCLNISNNYVQ